MRLPSDNYMGSSRREMHCTFKGSLGVVDNIEEPEDWVVGDYILI
jgi:hypothetical protein